MLPWLRDFTDLPLGVYPNLGYFTDDGWSFDKTVDGEQYGEMAAAWRQEGAQIIGGCCGTRPEHVAGARARVRDMPRGSRAWPRPPTAAANGALDRGLSRGPVAAAVDRRARPAPVPARDARARVRARRLRPHPRQLPGLEVPLPERTSAQGKRCLDIGCGTGMLAIELARNGAEHVHAIDIDRRAVANTLVQRLPQRRRRPHHRGGDRPLPVGAQGPLRHRRREPLPDARRPLRAAQQPPAAGLLGAQPARPPLHAAAQAAGRRAASPT